MQLALLCWAQRESDTSEGAACRTTRNKHAVFCSQPGAALVVAARFEVAARVLARAARLHVVVGLAEEGRVADVQGEAGGLGCEAVPA